MGCGEGAAGQMRLVRLAGISHGRPRVFQGSEVFL